MKGPLKERDPDTIYSWLNRYEAEGIKGLTIRDGRGRKPAYENLSSVEEAKEQVKQVLAQSPRQHGLASNRWSIELIQQTISW